MRTAVPTTCWMRSSVGAAPEPNITGLNIVDWQEFEELRGGDLAVIHREHAGLALGLEVGREPLDAAQGPELVELASELRHALGDGDDRAQRGRGGRLAEEASVGRAEVGQYGGNVVVVCVDLPWSSACSWRSSTSRSCRRR